MEKEKDKVLPENDQAPEVEKDDEQKGVIESRRLGNFRYLRRYIKCGKPGCRKCPFHGPYWYAQGRRKDGSRYEMYIGKEFRTVREISLQRKMDKLLLQGKMKGTESGPDLEQKKGQILPDDSILIV